MTRVAHIARKAQNPDCAATANARTSASEPSIAPVITLGQQASAGRCACGGSCPRCQTVRQADPPTTSGGSKTPPSPTKAPPSDPPKFLEGSIAIADKGTKVTANVGAMMQTITNSFTFANDFDVATSGVKIEEPANGLFQYGLVQNVFFSHDEARYSPQGDMLVDSVGPFVDVWLTETPPFFHEGTDNPVLASSGLFGQSTTVAAKYTDKPSISLKAFETACDQQVALKSAKHSLVFRAGLVARDMNNPARLIHLASTSATFGYSWDFSVDRPGQDMAYHITTSPVMTGSYTLSSTAIPVVLGGKKGVADINEKRPAEFEAMKGRCESVLDMPKLPLP